MKLQEKLKLYQETLKKDEPTNAFNPWAFIFNSFYYFYHDVSFGKFLAYFLATPLLFILFVLLKATPAAAFFYGRSRRPHRCRLPRKHRPEKTHERICRQI